MAAAGLAVWSRLDVDLCASDGIGSPCLAQRGQPSATRMGNRALRLEWTPQRALEHAEHTWLSAAVIDISRGVASFHALCEHLVKRNIPFAFYSEKCPADLGMWDEVPRLYKLTDTNCTADLVASVLNWTRTPVAGGRRTQSISGDPADLYVV